MSPGLLNNAPWPSAQANWVDRVVNKNTQKETFPLSEEAINWLTPLTASVNAAPVLVSEFVDLRGQNDAIAATSLVAGDDLNAGLYLLSIWSLVEVADGVSSSVQVTIRYTSNGVLQTFVGTNVNGDTVTSKSQQTVPIWIDAGTVVTYETTYASNTPNQMEYQLSIALQLIKART